MQIAPLRAKGRGRGLGTRCTACDPPGGGAEDDVRDLLGFLLLAAVPPLDGHVLQPVVFEGARVLRQQKGGNEMDKIEQTFRSHTVQVQPLAFPSNRM